MPLAWLISVSPNWYRTRFEADKRNCQELEPFICQKMASLLYLEPDSELVVRGASFSTMSQLLFDLLAEVQLNNQNMRRKKVKGVGADEATNPDVVLFEDNEEEEGGMPMAGPGAGGMPIILLESHLASICLHHPR
ncbi:zinc finger CCCH domain-containing protein 45-like isoform X1 [Canna indica]|uniref:Zinc finger CCCH domain-containing protein 45-like isoform X1 n=1 Tax=Canna indica TaxID=4628 RepID=A0AAQ3QQN0_9LILI|nr:zinc finger CCCH domain-containing protein 45-like isoform X1 [Canna indica]